jgi:hypothetical protein
MAQYFGDYSRIDRTYRGRRFGLAVRFWGPSTRAGGPRQEPMPEPHCSGVIEEVMALGGGRFALKMQRRAQRFFYVVAPQVAGQGATEVPYDAIMGGNVAMPYEWQRGYSHLNQGMAVRGSLMASRVVRGDGIVFQRERPTLPAMVLSAAPHAMAPEVVNYAGNEPLPSIRWRVLDLYSIQGNRSGPLVEWLNNTGDVVEEGELVVTPQWQGFAAGEIAAGASGAVRIDLAGELVFTGVNGGRHPSGLLIWDGDTPTTATRRVFAPSGGDADPDFLPANLGIAGFDGADYWVDPGTLEVRLSSFCALVGSEAELIHWVRTGATVQGEGIGAPVVVEGVGSGPGEEEDAATLSGWDVGGDFDQVFLVLGGEGALEWRQRGNADARRITVEVGESGPTGLTYRASPGGAAEAAAFSPAVYTVPYQVRITKTANEFEVQSRQSGEDEWTSHGTVELSEAVVANTDGVLGGTAWNGGFLRFAGAGDGLIDRRLITPAGGLHSVFRTSGRKAFGISLDTGLPVANVIEVRNLNTDQVMSLGSGVRRDQYRVVDGRLFAVAENSGDRWRITYAPTEAPPEPPGRAPRPVAGQLERGWVAIRPEPNPDFLPTEDVNENRANWHDVVEVRIEDGTVPVVGESVSFVRYGVFEPPPVGVPPEASLWFAIRNGGVEHYRRVPPEAVQWFWYAGLVLVERSWLEANVPTGARLCFRLLGAVLITDLLRDADRLTEIMDVAAGFDELWMQIPTGGNSPTRYAVISSQNFGIVSRDEFGRTNAVGLGFSNGNYRAGIPDVRAPGVGQTPFWDVDSGVPVFFDSFLRSGYIWNEVDEEDEIGVEGDGFVAVYTDATPVLGSDTRSFLGRLANQNPSDPDALITNVVNAQSGILFSPSEPFSTIPGDAVIEEAWLEVRFQSLITQHWESEWVFGPGLIAYRRETRNGEIVLELERDAAGEIVIDYLSPDPEPQVVIGGQIGFSIVGRRVDRGNVTRWNGQQLEIDASEYISVGVLGGGGDLTAVEDGEWQLVNITGAMRQLLALRTAETASDRYEIWATIGPPIGASPDGLSGFARGNHPVWTYSISGDLDDPTFEFRGSGRFARWDGLELGRMLVRFRSGLSGPMVRPLITPAAV